MLVHLKTHLPALLFLRFLDQTDDCRPWDSQPQMQFEIVFHLDFICLMGRDFD